jgi:hypothetical protein
LASAFKTLGYQVKAGDSTWRLDGTDEPLIRELAEGVAQAVRETAQVADERIAAWLSARSAAAACTIGHTDLLAIPRPA